MRFAGICIALGTLLVQSIASADTGFLDRSVTIGRVTHRYQVYVPADHSYGKAWPVVINLHGNGSQGPDGLLPTVGNMAAEIRRHRSRFPAVVLFPQAEVDMQWLYGDMEELVMAELDRTMAEFGGDPARVYLTGFSMGATGAYRIAYRWPNRFAAVVAIAGRVDTSNAETYSARDKQADRKANPFVTVADPFVALAERIGHLPIRILHGDADEIVPVEQSRSLVAALRGVRANVHYQEYPGATHADTAETAYGDQELLEWLLIQHQREPLPSKTARRSR